MGQDREGAGAGVKAGALAQVAGLRRGIAGLGSMAGTLSGLAESCCGDERPDCPILDDLAAGPAEDLRGMPKPAKRPRRPSSAQA